MKKGDIAVVYKQNQHKGKEWIGFTSEIKSFDTCGSWPNFKMLYGNRVRNEYSDMNFYDTSIIRAADTYEKFVYTKVLPEVKNILRGCMHVYPYTMEGNDSFALGDVVQISPYFNVYDGGIWATCYNSHSRVLVWKNKNDGVCKKAYSDDWKPAEPKTDRRILLLN